MLVTDYASDLFWRFLRDAVIEKRKEIEGKQKELQELERVMNDREKDLREEKL